MECVASVRSEKCAVSYVLSTRAGKWTLYSVYTYTAADIFLNRREELCKTLHTTCSVI